jgi:hypothetical protein
VSLTFKVEQAIPYPLLLDRVVQLLQRLPLSQISLSVKSRLARWRGCCSRACKTLEPNRFTKVDIVDTHGILPFDANRFSDYSLQTPT